MLASFYNEAQITVGEDTLTLVCNFRSIDVIESITGQTMDEVLPQLAAPSHSLVVKVLWALLREKHEDVTFDQAAGVIFDRERCIAVSAVIGDLFRRSFNMGEKPKEKDENPPKRRGRSRVSESVG